MTRITVMCVRHRRYVSLDRRVIYHTSDQTSCDSERFRVREEHETGRLTAEAYLTKRDTERLGS